MMADILVGKLRGGGSNRDGVIPSESAVGQNTPVVASNGHQVTPSQTPTQRD